MNDKKYPWRALILNPIVLVLYTILCHNLYSLAQYGGLRKHAPILIGTTLILFIWFLWTYFKYKRNKKPLHITENSTIIKISKWWFYIAIVFFISITSITGYRIYQSATNLNGRLAWVIDDWRTRRTISFSQNNIYEDGLTGLFDELDSELDLPTELYVVDEFSLAFNEDGDITDIYSFLYGNNAEGEVENFLIDYDAKDSKEVNVQLEGSVNTTFDADKKLEPLILGLESVPLEEYVAKKTDDAYEIYYEGFRVLPYNFDEHVYYDENGLVEPLGPSTDNIEGYSFTLSAADELRDRPTHFTYYNPEIIDEEIEEDEAQEIDPNEFSEEQIAEEFYLNDEIGYQLVMLDAMLGSRFYGLNQTMDGGESWEMINPDPFLGSTGVASGITFINEDLGFISLSHNGGMNANLFRTTNGGHNFERVELPSITVYQYGSEVEPFDFPEMPYEEDGELVLHVNQGIDGDYNNGVKGLFLSTDNGQTWEYFGEVE